MKNILELNDVNYNKEEYTSSKMQPDTLFNFMEKVEWLIEILQNKMISPRYCVEDITYLKIKDINEIAFPMKCFCDINLHKLHDHIGWYGACGIAFSKQWGMNRGIQPLHYINPKSQLRIDFSQAFNTSWQSSPKRQSEAQRQLKNYLMHELMYYKPYSGISTNRITSETSTKCFTDECEWRYLADVSMLGYEQIIIYDNLNKEYINQLSASLNGVTEISLNFDYSDIKYLIVANDDDYSKLTNAIMELFIDQTDKYLLISKIIIWDKSKGDF